MWTQKKRLGAGLVVPCCPPWVCGGGVPPSLILSARRHVVCWENRRRILGEQLKPRSRGIRKEHSWGWSGERLHEGGSLGVGIAGFLSPGVSWALPSPYSALPRWTPGVRDPWPRLGGQAVACDSSIGQLAWLQAGRGPGSDNLKGTYGKPVWVWGPSSRRGPGGQSWESWGVLAAPRCDCASWSHHDRNLHPVSAAHLFMYLSQ